MKKIHQPIPILAIVLLLILACNLPGQPTVPPTATPVTEIGEVTPPPPPPEEPSPTSVPDVTSEGGCTLNSAFVADVTVPDDTPFPPGTAFTKTWRVRNTGTCTWEPGTLLVFVSGDAMDAPPSVPVGLVAPGATTDVSVNLVAPATPGTYKGNWQLQAPDGTRFGSVVYVQIVVTEPAPETTATPTEEPTEEPTGEPPSGCVEPDPTLVPIIDHAADLGYDLGCPTAESFTVYGAFQYFWTNIDNPNPHLHYRSLMIWRSDNKEIYVIVGEDTDASRGVLLAYTDFWDESQPEVHPDCADMTVPDGYQLPVRGFGKVWCENQLWEQIGWPDQPESAATLLIQPMESGLAMRVSTPVWDYLIALHYQGVYGITMYYTP